MCWKKSHARHDWLGILPPQAVGGRREGFLCHPADVTRRSRRSVESVPVNPRSTRIGTVPRYVLPSTSLPRQSHMQSNMRRHQRPIGALTEADFESVPTHGRDENKWLYYCAKVHPAFDRYGSASPCLQGVLEDKFSVVILVIEYLASHRDRRAASRMYTALLACVVTSLFAHGHPLRKQPEALQESYQP